MAATDSTQPFLDTGAARLLALGIAILLAIILAFGWGKEIGQVLSGADQPALPEVVGSDLDLEQANPELAACLQQRLGDVDRMRDEGILSESQYAGFKQRAEDLCYQLNPN